MREGVPHVCYCFTPMRYAPCTDATLTRADWRARPIGALGAARRLLDSLRSWDRRTAEGVTHFVAISETASATGSLMAGGAA